jgi:hypothetical protein
MPLQKVRRRYAPDDPFFEEGNAQREELAKQTAFELEESDDDEIGTSAEAYVFTKVPTRTCMLLLLCTRIYLVQTSIYIHHSSMDITTTEQNLAESTWVCNISHCKAKFHGMDFLSHLCCCAFIEAEEHTILMTR